MIPLLLLLSLTPYSNGLPEGFIYTGELNLTYPILVSLRYGTDRNFVGSVVRGNENIPSQGAVVTAEAGDALAKAQTEFSKNGYGIVIYDSYRPSRAVDHFMEWAENEEDDEYVKRMFYPNVAKSDLFDLGYIASRSGHSRGSTIDRTLHSVLKSTIEEHRQRFVPGSSARDYIDAYLQQIEECEDPKSSFYDEEGVLNLIDGLTNFCVPGTDSISSSMSFALLYVSSSRDVMKKIHAEIDAVIGRQRLPDPADRPNMPYMSAVVNETFRLSSIIPGDVLHSTTAATEIGGYSLPKGTIIMPNLYQVHHDEKYWGDPENFRPERFLNPDGTFRKDERVIPFSIGKRVCVAEGLAQVQFFLFLTGAVFDFNA